MGFQWNESSETFFLSKQRYWGTTEYYSTEGETYLKFAFPIRIFFKVLYGKVRPGMPGQERLPGTAKGPEMQGRHKNLCSCRPCLWCWGSRPTPSTSRCPCAVAPRATRSLALGSALLHLSSRANEQHRPNSQAGVFRKALLFLSVQGTASSLPVKTSPVWYTELYVVESNP